MDAYQKVRKGGKGWKGDSLTFAEGILWTRFWPLSSCFISFFAGRQPSGIIQFRLKQKSAPVESKIFEHMWEADVRRQLADGLSPFKS